MKEIHKYSFSNESKMLRELCVEFKQKKTKNGRNKQNLFSGHFIFTMTLSIWEDLTNTGKPIFVK
jgi:hypothetical protein